MFELIGGTTTLCRALGERIGSTEAVSFTFGGHGCGVDMRSTGRLRRVDGACGATGCFVAPDSTWSAGWPLRRSASSVQPPDMGSVC
jgi:hypothetical protein